MTEILNSIGKWFKERSTSPLYGTFIFSLILWNWKFFYILFWQSEEKLPLPRIEYVDSHFLYLQNIWIHLIFFVILPAISTYVIVFWFPWLNNWAHKKHLDFYYKKRLIMDNALLDYEKQEKKNLDSIVRIKKEQKIVKDEIKQNMSIEENWSIDSERFKEHILYNGMEILKNALYDNSGKIRKWDGKIYAQIISKDVLAMADSRGLIEITGKDNEEKISLTEKGKFFMSKYIENY